ncbi:FkbM family methyltransferase [Thiohalophilus sp.]|uniref:FkbM family methyltransferase n=1 Tax=Thiohalophilus sp. TaxID=3028392 RepID=UPI002ACD790A|nr:FkbM family methyltransferase [Thiohalophilus sp.]MDZ7803349.1 FkbM family methyltransferase [Thiohalophilus sp.]
MSKPILKRIEQSDGYKFTKLLVKRLVGEELWLRPEIRINTLNKGGWLFYPDRLNSESVVYSFGVGEDIDFDLVLINQFGLSVYAFDPTPSTVDWLSGQSDIPGKFQFHPWAVTDSDGSMTLYPRVRGNKKSKVMYTLIAEEGVADSGVDVPAFTIGSIMAKLGHDHIDLMKIDIEGAEYDVLENMLDHSIKPEQLLVEFHHRIPGIGPKKTAALIRRLRAAGYRLFAISETGRELSFLLQQ